MVRHQPEAQTNDPLKDSSQLSAISSHLQDPNSETFMTTRPDTSAGDTSWWQQAVFYQIYPRSFAGTSGNGIGDLAGITQHLDDLAWLGVDVLWISPFFRSPMHDFGYDVADYCDVDPLFGSLADFDNLLSEAHQRGLRVIIDWVPAHTSIEHPWFQEARSSRSSPKRDWYVWRDPQADGTLPNNWRAAFGTDVPAWTLDRNSGQYYLHSFLPEQPDLNWANAEVREAMYDTLRFWLDRGVDGFRADVVHNIGKDPALASVEDSLAAVPHCALNDVPETHEYLREIRSLIDAYPGERMVVGEVFLLDVERMATYYGKGDELHLAFNFPVIFLPWDAAAWKNCIDSTDNALRASGGWPTWVLSNHDFSRHRSRFGGGEARARAAAVLLTCLRGTPYLYMGEELGLEDAEVPESAKVDPGGRDGCRAPIPWLEADGHGWTPEPWLPFPPESGRRSWQTQRDDSNSVLHLYRRLLSARKESAALRAGDMEWLEGGEDLLVWRRWSGNDERVVVVSFSSQPQSVALPTPYRVGIATDHQREGAEFDGVVAADTALVLEPLEAATPHAID